MKNQKMQKIPSGYKQTEIGVIPEEWDLKKLGDVADITKLAGFEYTNYFNSYKDGGEIIVIRGTNITQNKLDLRDIKTIPRLTSNKLPRSKLSKNDLVFAYVGTIGPVFLVDEDNAYHLGPNTSKITAQDCISPKFLFTYFTSRLIQNEIAEHTSIGAQPSLSMTKIRKFRIILPPTKSEQTAIATVLSDTDALIEKLEKLIAKKKAIKQGVMQQLLTGKKRLPGFSGDWEVKKLGEVGNCIRGVSYNGERDLSLYDTNITVRLLRSNNIRDGKIDLSELQFVNISRVKQIQALQKNDIVICMANGSKQLVGKSAMFDVSDNYTYTFGAFMGCFRTNPNQAVSRFISFIFQTYQYRSYIDVLLSGSSINNLKPSDIESIEIAYPKKEEQTAIAAILSDMDAEIVSLEKKRDKYIMLKLGMMQQLLTGRIRIYANN